jgi:hypothetical protein
MRGRNEEIALILAIIVVSYDDDCAFGEGFDRSFNALVIVRHRFYLKAASGLERPRRPLADLPAMHQIVIGQHACHHRLTYRHRADADTRIVPTLGNDLGVTTIAVDGLARGEDRGCWLDREPRDYGLSGRNSAKNSPGVVR